MKNYCSTVDCEKKEKTWADERVWVHKRIDEIVPDEQLPKLIEFLENLGQNRRNEALKVQAFKIVSDQKMLITFSNGDTRLFDASILYHGADPEVKDSVFLKLADRDVFHSARLDHGVIVWMDGAIDCSPDFMYSKSEVTN